jgi:hypothetical protein
MKHWHWILSLSLLPYSLCPARPWTNHSGKTIEADLMKLDGESVVLLAKGKEYRIPVASLSAEDQAFAKEEAQRRTKEQADGARKFMGQELVPGQLHEFDFDISEENKKIASTTPKGWRKSFAARYPGDWIKDLAKTHSLEKIRVLLGVPENFDPSKGCPIFVQWTTGDAKSNVMGGKDYWETCREKGWMLVSVDGAPDSTALWSNTVFLAEIKEFFEQLHAKYPGSEQWKVATGGFSGGSKLCQWMGALMNDLKGVSVTGYWLGGCNEAFFDYAMEDLKVKKAAYSKAKIYISTGEKDELIKPESHKALKLACKETRFAEVRSESYDGGHSMSHQQLAEALDWFLK